MKTIGLIYAMQSEIESFLTPETEILPAAAGVGFYRVTPQILACTGGIGKVNIAMATQLLIDRYRPDVILNVGVAGAMEDLPVGTVALAKCFVQHDMDTSAIGDPVGLVSTVNTVEFACAGVACGSAILDRMGVPHILAKVATGDWFATDSPRARRIRELFCPDLCEMEGCAVAQVCLRNKVPFLALKAVSDRLFSAKQAEEYFDFSKAMEQLNAIALPFAQALLQEEF